MPYSFELLTAIALASFAALQDYKLKKINNLFWVLAAFAGVLYALFTWTGANALLFCFVFSTTYLFLSFVPDSELGVGDKNFLLALSLLVTPIFFFVMSASFLMLVASSLLTRKPVAFIPFVWLSLILTLVL